MLFLFHIDINTYLGKKPVKHGVGRASQLFVLLLIQASGS